MPRIAGTSPGLEVGDRQDDDPACKPSQDQEVKLGAVIKEHGKPRDSSRPHSWEAFCRFRDQDGPVTLPSLADGV
jgi:hypothetical protein